MFTQIPTNAGVYLDDTPREAQGFFINADKVRFVRGLPQVMGGWEAVTNSTVTGICRGLATWADNTGIKWIAIGTHTNAYAVTDATIYDITPVASRGQLTNPFTTTISLTSVSVAHTAHGRAVGDGVFFSGASAVGGITIDGAYTVVTALTDSYTITASSAATSSAGPGGGTVNYKYFLAIGLASATFALGFGTGFYSAGTYSVPGAGAPYARTWAIAPYGGNILLNVRGGGIYEWCPTTSATELVTNGDFASGGSWTPGAGWAIGGGVATASVSMTGLTQTILAAPMAYFIIECDVTRSAGSLQISLNSTNVGAAISATANFKATVYGGNAGGSVTLAFTGSTFTGTLDNVTVKQLTTAELLTNAPTQNTCMVVTPDKFVMACGTIEANTGNFNPMHIRWSDIAPNHHTWTPSSTNLSRSWTLGVGSRIVAAKCSNTEVLVWTDKALYAAVYSQNSNVIYDFRLVGQGCGLIGANAATVLSGIAYWLSPDGTTYRYAGGAAEAMQSTMQQDVFNNIAYVQQDKIFAAPIGNFQNVKWLYPDKRDGTNEVSRYALLCSQEPAPRQGGGPVNIGVWAPGTSTRTAWADASEGVYQNPVAVDADGSIYFQERGTTANGGNISWLLETGAAMLGDGETLWKADTFVPDFERLGGGCSMTAYSYLYPQSTPVAHGPFNITAMTDKLGLLSDAPVGRQISFLFQGNASPATMRSGHLMMDISDTGMNF